MSSYDDAEELEGTEIAVVGMACRLPGSRTADEFWTNVRDGVEAVRPYSDDELREAGVAESLLRHPNYIKMGAPLEDMEMFDAAFFGFGPRDASILDPQHRHFLEVSWEALEHAGQDPARFPGSVGVFGGSGHNAYLPYNLLTNPDLVASVGFFLLRHTGNDKDFLTTRVSYNFDLKGPSVNVQTACSTSLVAIHLATQSLLNGECDMALAGGVTIEMPHRQGYMFLEGEILSSDGHCRSFDAQSDGTIFGSGCGVVVLRRLADALADGDTVHAIVKGSAMNNDGAGKVNYLAPSVDGQAAAISEALALAGVDADTVTYVETHGTGTRIGDPIEVSALSQAFSASTERKGYCGIGSVKTNIGHLDTAAGIASFIKVIQALKHRQLPPTLHYKSPNPMLNIEETPFYVNDKLRDWESGDEPRRAGVSSLGVGGTNAHIVLEQAPLQAQTAPAREWELLQFSARGRKALDGASHRMADFLSANPDINLADVAHTLRFGRQGMPHRRVVAVQSTHDAVEALRANDVTRVASAQAGDGEPDIVFMFPGGGAQYPNMGLGLYQNEPVYRKAVDECLALLKPQLDIDLAPLMFPTPEEADEAAHQLERPILSLPSIFITEYALARLLMSWGIEPVAMTGHSMGEYAAACISGVFSTADALAIVTTRGILFESLPEGAMISVPMTESGLAPLLVDGCDIGVVNNPELCVVSGAVGAIEAMEKLLADRGVDTVRVPIKVAAHSTMLDPILEEFDRRLRQVTFNEPNIPFISNTTGTWAKSEDVTTPEYWVKHLRHTVRFADGLRELMQRPNQALLEVGPGQTLGALTRMHPQRQTSHNAVATLRHRDAKNITDSQFLLTAIGRLWMAGVAIEKTDFDGERDQRRIPLPTYAFEHQRYWIDPGNELFGGAQETSEVLAKLPAFDDWFYRPEWSKTALAETNDGHPNAPVLIFDEGNGLGAALASAARAGGHTVITVAQGDQFRQIDDGHYELNARARADFDALIEELLDRELAPEHIVHLWAVTTQRRRESRLEFYERTEDFGFYSLFFLAQSLGEEEFANPISLLVATNGMQRVADERVPYADKAIVLGPAKVIPREIPGVTCSAIDIELDGLERGFWPAAATRAAAGLLAREFAREPQNSVVAYRGGTRYQQAHVRAGVEEAGSVTRVRDGGVYLITGGLGGIGLVLAHHLASVAKVKLILLGRSELPEPAKWDRWLDSHSDADKTSVAIESIRRLEAAGAEVLALSADVANPKQLSRALKAAKARFGPINGVAHAAGVIDDNLIQLKSPQDADRVLKTKVRGAIALDEQTASEPLDFFILYSSTSSTVGAAGQVDYVAANAYLNALAESRTAAGKPYTVAINWGVWQAVGMAVRVAVQQGLANDVVVVGEDVSHPLLGRIIVRNELQTIFSANYSVDDLWMLSEHRIANGSALVPGTGYLEIARAAFAEVSSEEDVAILNLGFLEPLEVEDGSTREVRVSLERAQNGYDFKVTSRLVSGGSGAPQWREHATATLEGRPRALGAQRDLAAIRARCAGTETVWGPGEQQTRQEDYLDFGPRWKVIRCINVGEAEALGELELSEQFVGDLEHFQLHPALMDLATSIALPVINGFEGNGLLFVPFTYDQVRVHAPLTRRIFAHSRYRGAQSIIDDVPVFDISILDDEGRVLVEVSGFATKGVEPESMQTGALRPSSPVRAEPEGNMLTLALTDGISPAEGADAMARVLSGVAPAQLTVTSLDLELLIRNAGGDTMEEGDGGMKLSRPDLANEYEAPRNSVETALVGLWQELLGIDQIGIRDDFFELGGHSLIAVRLLARVKKHFGADLSLATLFEARTIGDFFELLERDYGVSPEDASEAAPRKSRKRRVATREWSPMVAIQSKGRAPPFFCVHGGHGNVLGFYDLTRYLGVDQPFYGLQARGVDGLRPPHQTMDAMVAEYIKEIRTVQARGPYYLGGFSMGGEVAFEIGRRLQEQGDSVAFIGMLDTGNPEATRILSQGYPSALGYPDPASKAPIAPLTGPQASLLGRAKAFVEFTGYRAVTALIGTGCRIYMATGRSLPQAMLRPYLWNTHTILVNQYTPRPFDGKVTVFRASETAGWNPDAEGIGWRRLARAGFDIYYMEGTHDIIKEPYAKKLAELLQDALHNANVESGEGEVRDEAAE
jgi:acyl transferase domain-containing protein/thioesterase domain-containing protein/acyl carrier protein